MSKEILIEDARENNLKNVSLKLPREAIVVITGVSGSGKSSLAFDTIFQEGQRKYVESLSAYARQFIGSMKAPEVGQISGITPTISIDQKTVNRNPRSTVGTVTEIQDHLRLLFARLGTAYCPTHKTPIQAQTTEQIADRLLLEHSGARLTIMAPVVQERKGEYRKELEEYRLQGFVRMRIDGEIRELEEKIVLGRYEKHTLELVIDRLKSEEKNQARLREALRLAHEKTQGLVSVLVNDEYMLLNTGSSCTECGFSVPEIEPRLFSFNDPQGQCSHCKGLGYLEQFDLNLLIPDQTKSVNQGAILAQMDEGHMMFSRYGQYEFEILAKAYGFSLDTPWQDLSPVHQRILTRGSDRPLKMKIKRQLIEKIIPGFLDNLEATYNKYNISLMHKYMKRELCPTCKGQRLNSHALCVRFANQNIYDLTTTPIIKLRRFFGEYEASEKEMRIGRELFIEIRNRLEYLDEVGLGYLTLARNSATLSGGEAQRIRLASQVGAGLQGVTYVLDEPSIGLHSRDNEKLLGILKKLKDLGNSLIIVEHDEDTMKVADCIVDIGPGAGVLGGEILAQGQIQDLLKNPLSLTGQYLSGQKQVEIPKTRRKASEEWLKVLGAKANNLKNIDVAFPVGLFTCITGVSGSGKSTLIHAILKKEISKKLTGTLEPAAEHKAIEGIEYFDKLIEIDQSPIGRTPRSNPATYTKIFDEIRDLFCALPESKLRGYNKGRFSFNVPGGRCEECGGAGVKVVEMQLLADVLLTCEECSGHRFNDATLEIHYKGKSISDVLNMTIDEALEFFAGHPKIRAGLQILAEIGLGYIRLGQPSPTLSGGEAQRMKVATELKKRGTGKTLYILDEPTTGLHFEDIRKLLQCMQDLVNKGNTLLVIEHNLDVAKSADWIIDLGPEGGDGGGRVICVGTPEEVAKNKQSHTARFLKQALKPTFADLNALPFAPKDEAQFIEIIGARKNNLKDIRVQIPHDKLTVITGVSGAGKTSLAFHTLFAEGQRRFVESLSTYARRFLGAMDRASVEAINGLAPAIAVDQGSANRSSRSTVATITELYDYYRLLFARVGIAHCPTTGVELQKYSALDLWKLVNAQTKSSEEAENYLILAPIFIEDTAMNLMCKSVSQIEGIRSKLVEQGYRRFWVDGQIIQTEDETQALPIKAKEVFLLIDRVKITANNKSRFIEAVEKSHDMAHAMVGICAEKSDAASLYSAFLGATQSRFFLLEELEPKHFSFNSHWGACDTCQGLGRVGPVICPTCKGERLKPEFAAVKVGNQSITRLTDLSIEASLAFFSQLKLNKDQQKIASQILKEILGRLHFLNQVGLGYIELGRRGDTLSGGEAQRIRLASQIGSGLQGVLYVLDEPTIGLHQKDTQLLIQSLYHLRDLGNTVVVVEQDLEFVAAADEVIEMGPKAGEFGGEVVVQGSPKAILKQKNSLSAAWLSGEKTLKMEQSQKEFSEFIHLKNVKFRNLKNLSLKFPLGGISVVTGVSGSGKSTLVSECLQPLAQKCVENVGLKVVHKEKGTFISDQLLGEVLYVDQSPIGTTPRSTPATYTNLFDKLRDLYASLSDAKIKGFDKGYFSFNKPGGRCEACEGRGYHYIEMHFLSDVWEKCESCHGRRFGKDVLEVKYREKSIADIMDMTCDEARIFFAHQKSILKIVEVLCDIGLGYIRLGQPATALSGGEAQRMKLATELAKANKSRSLFLLDEPTTGLHSEDIEPMWKLLKKLSAKGHSLVIVEHHIGLIEAADWVIDLGPVGGQNGGELLFMGTPENLLTHTQNETSIALQRSQKYL